MIKQLLATLLSAGLLLPQIALAQEEESSNNQDFTQLINNWSFVTLLVFTAQGLEQAHQICLDLVDCPEELPLRLAMNTATLNPFIRRFFVSLDLDPLSLDYNPALQQGVSHLNQQLLKEIQALKLSKFGFKDSELHQEFNKRYQEEMAQVMIKVKYSSLKANMHTLQTIVETYAVDHEGKYASSLSVLINEAQNSSYGNYWKDFTNPLTESSGQGKSVLAFKDFVPGDTKFKGMVLYQVIDNQGAWTTYKIYGVDESGQLLLDKGQPFILSNE